MDDAALEVLLDAVDGFDQLVLLGDTVELTELGETDALAIAAPILRAIGARVGAEREIVLVPGNHDGGLVRAWLPRHGQDLNTDSAVPADATPALARTVACLAPARVRVHYPGVWLSDSIWATHGHYLDRHLFPIGAYGIARNRGVPSGRLGWTPLDYERALAPDRARLDLRLPAPLAALYENLSELARAWTMPRRRRPTRSWRLPHLSRLLSGLLSPRLAPLTAALLSGQMRRFSIPALLSVVEHLGVDADWVLFGHVHRLGPLPGDDPARWAAPNGRPRVANSGSWLYEPLLLHHALPPHPYWPGGAIVLEQGCEPRAVGLLDSFPASMLGRAQAQVGSAAAV
jgi:hypothetical protein